MPESPPITLWAAWSSALVEKFKLDISKEESQQLLVKYDLQNNGKFAYCDFIQSCVLLLKAKETSLMRRMRIQNADKMVGVSPWRPWGYEPGTPRLSAQVDLDTQPDPALPAPARTRHLPTNAPLDLWLCPRICAENETLRVHSPTTCLRQAHSSSQTRP